MEVRASDDVGPGRFVGIGVSNREDSVVADGDCGACRWRGVGGGWVGVWWQDGPAFGEVPVVLLGPCAQCHRAGIAVRSSIIVGPCEHVT